MPTQIRGEQIKDGSVDSIDIASGSIKAGELNAQAISGQTTIVSTDTINDRLLVWDATDSSLKQVSIGNLGVTAAAAGSDGQIQYNNGGSAMAGSSGIYWDDTNNRAGIGTASPTSPLHVYGNLNGTYVATIDNDQNSNGHVLKLLTDGTGTGSRVLEMEDGDGDIIFRARADGRFGFGPDGVDSMGAGTFVVGIDNSSHTSDIAISQRMQHLGDGDTYLDFPAADQIKFVAGNMEMVRMVENGGSSEITFNDGASADLGLVVKGQSNNPLFKCDATNNRVGIGGVGSPTQALEVGGDIGINEKIVHNGDTDTYLAFTGQNEINLVANGYSFLKYDGNIKINNANRDRDTQIMADNGNVVLHVDAGTNKVGIGTTSPKTGLDIHHSPVFLTDNTGGGECVTFGAGTTVAGKLYYLNGDSPPIWAEIDASAAATGADQMVGIALGTSSADGILIRGFFDATTYLSSFSAGKAVYMSETAASMTTVVPTTAGAIVRIMGYCTDTANVIYFNPSNNWIELA